MSDYPYLGIDNSSFDEEDTYQKMSIEFDYKTENFYGEIYEDSVSGELKGWFEHNEYGDEYGGGLWFLWVGKTPTLVDYDGISGYLPKEIIDELTKEGFDMSYGEDPDEN